MSYTARDSMNDHVVVAGDETLLNAQALVLNQH